ncbi:MAG: hypothetical protein V7607_1686 [Solirubrobacteraceae bacterium]
MPDIGVLRAPRSIVFGEGAVDVLGDTVAAHGRRVVVCTDPVIAASPGGTRALRRLRAAGLDLAVLDQAVAELPRGAVEAAAFDARAASPDCIVGLGGGSSLDLAKLVSLLLAFRERPLESLYGEGLVPAPGLPVVAVPTTAGTGSEVTPVAVLSDPAIRLKVGIASPYLVPSAAVVDPELTYGAPPAVTAFAGIDALAHAIEAYTAVRRGDVADAAERIFVGANVLSDPYALAAVGSIAPHLRAAVDDEPGARAHVARGSLSAGIAFAAAGTAAAHALQYPIGARTGTPHGLGVGLLLAHVMRFNAEERSDELAAVAVAAGFGTSADDAREGVARLAADVGVPRTLAELGVTADELPELAAQAAGIERLAANNPRTLNVDAALEILGAALGAGARDPSLDRTAT